MSGGPAALLGDDEVLDPSEPVLEFGGTAAVSCCGGKAVLPQRGDWRTAQAAGISACGHICELGDAVFRQVVVKLERSRPGFRAACHAAWQHLAPGGRLLIYGDNRHGISSALRQLGAALNQDPQVLSNRAKARVAAFSASDAQVPAEPSASFDAGFATLHAEPGVFSAGRLDVGSALLLTELAPRQAPTRVLDLACGSGVLGLACLQRWPEASAWGGDADARAIASARVNAAALGCAQRFELAWWEAAEPLDREPVDLVVCNPPFHAGDVVSFAIAEQLFAHAAGLLAPNGEAWIVANRGCPYEPILARLGNVSIIAERDGFRLFRLEPAAA